MTDPSAASAPTDANPYRLPRNVVPSHYNLTLQPDLDEATFSGTCEVSIEVTAATHTVVLNAIELDITEAFLSDSDGRTDFSISLDEDLERATLTASQVVNPGAYILTITFAGILNDKLRGFYRSTFTDNDGVDHVIATTQFESTNARRAFPCWDEPDLKAVFEVTLVVPDNLMAISCAAQVDSTPMGNDTVAIRYAPTMLMSTYLLAFIVGPFEATDPVDVNGTPVRIVHPMGKGHLVDFAMEAATFSLAHFEDYFAIPYPGDKLDLLAIPDFAFGAMENLGAVTFREILLVLDREASTQPEQQRSADVIAHELAHMWFGDLVTMKWWEGIWLKEAFATFMEMHATNAWRPDWERWVDFGLSRTAAFDTDSLESTRPIEFPVVSPADAEGMYDILTYEKGAAVVRMLEQFLGETTFRDGVRHYLTKHSYGATETTDLWDALEETSGQPVRAVMDSWIYQGGYPIVSVSTIDDTTIRLSQERFRYDGVQSGETWGVPIVLKTFRDGTPSTLRVLLSNNTTDLDVGEHDAVLVNAEASGFYRVSYDEASRAALMTQRPGDIKPIERYGIIDDAWASVVSGTTSPATFMALAEQFIGDEDVSVVTRIAGALGSIEHLLADEHLTDLQRWVRTFVRPVLAATGDEPVSGESDRTSERRAVLFDLNGTVGGDPATVGRARELLANDDADPSLRAAATRVVASVASAADFEDLVARFQNAATPQDERRYSFALAIVPGPDQFARLLKMTIDGTIRTQDAPYLLGRALSNRTHGTMAWDFVEANWQTIVDTFPSNSIVRMLDGSKALSTTPMVDRVADFLADHPVEQGEKTLQQILERQRINVGLRHRINAEVAPFVAAVPFFEG